MRSDYEAAHEGVALAPRWNRRFLEVSGRAPGQMLMGILTNTVPGAQETMGEGMYRGEVRYSAILTPKGRMITDLRIFRMPGEEDAFLLVLPATGMKGAVDHFRRFLPPRLAEAREVGGAWGLLTLVGPEAQGLLTTVLGGSGAGDGPDLKILGEALEGLEEGDEVVLPDTPFGSLHITPNGEMIPQAWDLLVSGQGEGSLRARLSGAGAQPLVPDTLEVLRIERGRPAFGKDMDTDTIPVEAGIHDRAVDHEKGCYTGQEVIVRIRDRGHVNKHLRGILLGDLSVPKPGEELYSYRQGKVVGYITSACYSPAFEETIALGYLNRRIHPGDEVRLGADEGPPGRVRALGDDGWEMDVSH